MKTTLETSIRVTLPAHRIVYTGLNKRQATAIAALYRKAGATVTRDRRRCLGSKRTDLYPWHYTVVASGLTQAVLDSIVQ